MNINLENSVVSNEKKIILNAFFPDSTDEEFITIKKINKVDEIKYNLYLKKIRKNKIIGESKKTYDEIIDELIDNDVYNQENEATIKSLADIGELTCKTFIDLSVIPDEKHTFYYEKDGEKKFHNINYESLMKIANQLGKPKLIDFIFSECKDWNTAFFG